MKKQALSILLCISFILVSNILFSQTNNLYFNQVLKVNFTGAGTTFIVPAGKVWKVEQAVANTIDEYSCTWGYGIPTTIRIDGALVYLHRSLNSPGGPSVIGTGTAMFPLWYPAGSYSVFAQGSNCLNNQEYKNGYLSVIEFNVAP